MRARLAVASNALNCDDLSLPSANLTHRILLEEINAHANLVFSDKQDLATFLQALQSDSSLPQDARTRWAETLIRLRTQGRIAVTDEHPKPLAAVSTLQDLRAAWAKHAEVAVVANSACKSLEIPPIGVRSDPGSRPDVAAPAAVVEAAPLRRIKDLADRPLVAKGTDRDEFWRDVLEPLAAGALHATILDRYLFKPALDVATRKPWTRKGAGEHLRWLLTCLDEAMAPNSEVRLIGQCPTEYASFSVEDIADAVRESWNPPGSGRLATVNAIVAPVSAKAKFPHDRHIRFSTGAAIGITAGFDRLRTKKVSDEDGMAWSFVWQPSTLQALEARELRGASYAPANRAVVLRR